MSLVLFELLPQHWNLVGVNLNKFLCGPFKRNVWDCRSPSLHSTIIPTGFYSHKLWELLFLVLEPWTRLPGVGLGLLLSGDLHS